MTSYYLKFVKKYTPHRFFLQIYLSVISKTGKNFSYHIFQKRTFSGKYYSTAYPKKYYFISKMLSN